MRSGGPWGGGAGDGAWNRGGAWGGGSVGAWGFGGLGKGSFGKGDSWGRGSFGKGDSGGKGFDGGGKGGRSFFDRDEEAYSAFNRTTTRRDGVAGDGWVPGRGRNLDLETEGGSLGRWYNEHDDRRGGEEPGGRRRGSSPGGAWKHDLFEVARDTPREPREPRESRSGIFGGMREGRDKYRKDVSSEASAVAIEPGMKVRNWKGRSAKVVEAIDSSNFKVKFDDDGVTDTRPLANFTTEDGRAVKHASRDKEKSSVKEEAADEPGAKSSGDAVTVTPGLRVKNRNGRDGEVVELIDGESLRVRFDDKRDETSVRPLANFTSSDGKPLKSPQASGDKSAGTSGGDEGAKTSSRDNGQGSESREKRDADGKSDAKSEARSDDKSDGKSDKSD